MQRHPADNTPWHARYSRSDLLLAALGILLALFCALFPLYIFYNRDDFGIRPLKFQGDTGDSAGAGLAPRSRLMSEPLELPELAPAVAEGGLDALATGTLPADGLSRAAQPGVDEQPFPSRPGDFRLIHVANGRAMIEDEKGLWIVQPGSMLPDDSRVSSIERRAGRWVLVTNSDRVVPISD
jgi:hypothetical protein